MENQRGFTLIELIIAIAIIGLLAVIAVSQYQLYIVKAQLGRVFHEVGELRLTVEDCLNDGKQYIGLSASECDPRASASDIIQGSSQVGIVLPANSGVAQMSNPLTAQTIIMASLSNQVALPLRAKKLAWQRQTNGSWYCVSNVEQKYLPNSCQYRSNL